MATELKHTVTPAGQGGEFTTVDLAMNHIETSHANFVSADVYATIEIGGDWTGVEDSDHIAIGATCTMDATHYLRIYTTAAARHSGKWDTGAYIYHVTGMSGINMNGCTGYVYFDGLQIQVTGVNATLQSCIMRYTTPLVVVSNCIIRGDPNEDTYAQYAIAQSDGHAEVFNTLIYDFGTTAGRGIYLVSPASVDCYNVVCIGGKYGFYRSSGSFYAKNCYCGGSTLGDYTALSGMTTCASSDSSGSTGLRNIAPDSNTFIGAGDYHLSGAASPLYHAGTDTSGSAAPMNFTTDIDGDPYYDTGGVRSIGIDEYTGTLATGEHRSTRVTMNW